MFAIKLQRLKIFWCQSFSRQDNLEIPSMSSFSTRIPVRKRVWISPLKYSTVTCPKLWKSMWENSWLSLSIWCSINKLMILEALMKTGNLLILKNSGRTTLLLLRLMWLSFQPNAGRWSTSEILVKICRMILQLGKKSKLSL